MIICHNTISIYEYNNKGMISNEMMLKTKKSQLLMNKHTNYVKCAKTYDFLNDESN